MATTVDSWREQAQLEARALSDKALEEAIIRLQDQLQQWFAELGPEAFNAPFYEYAMSDIEATMGIYFAELKTRKQR